jgi:hypothetical protein
MSVLRRVEGETSSCSAISFMLVPAAIMSFSTCFSNGILKSSSRKSFSRIRARATVFESFSSPRSRAISVSFRPA